MAIGVNLFCLFVAEWKLFYKNPKKIFDLLEVPLKGHYFLYNDIMKTFCDYSTLL